MVKKNIGNSGKRPSSKGGKPLKSMPSPKTAKASPPAAVKEASKPSFSPFTARDYADAVFDGGTVSGGGFPEGWVAPCTSSEKRDQDKAQWNIAVDKVITTLRCFNIDSDWCHTSHLASSNYNNHRINPPVKCEGHAVRLFCTKCKKNKKTTLVAHGVCTEGRTDGIGVKMIAIFPHNSDCDSDKPTPVMSPYTLVDYDFDIVVGNTYAKELQEINDQTVRKNSNLIGVKIDFDDPNHRSDDRSYVDLPLTSDRAKAHKECMTRLLLHVSVKLNLVEETVHEHFNWDSARSGTKNNNSWDSYPVKVNEAAHLFISDTSLLFGGHNLNDKGPLQDQRCHTDVDGLDDVVFHQGRSKPGSIIVPLEDFRSIYVGIPFSPDYKIITIPKGKYFFFQGDVAHGGKTVPKNEKSWHTAVHLHIDTKYHARTKDLVEFANHEDLASQQASSYLRSFQEIYSTALESRWESFDGITNEQMEVLAAILGKLSTD